MEPIHFIYAFGIIAMVGLILLLPKSFLWLVVAAVIVALLVFNLCRRR